MDTVINAIGGPINALILASLVADVLVAIALLLCVSGGHDLWKKRKAKRALEAAREAEALIGADATPTVTLFVTDDLRGVDDLRNLCLLGAPVDFVEDLFYDLWCPDPCEEHPRCLLAN